ncbi:hypothetical protein [Amycolatopsis sp. NPDC021455]|uniref:hypothetical protein n=1 Tax=Amycolatopsis sp. NPDC021455 TaxID=3154901 RepID=UPI0034098211
MGKHHSEGDDAAPEGNDPASEEEESQRGEGRRAHKARRVVTAAQLVLAIAQAVDGVLRIFS